LGTGITSQPFMHLFAFGCPTRTWFGAQELYNGICQRF
jgi:hypothetical protein